MQWSLEDDELLIELTEAGKTRKELVEHFPSRSISGIKNRQLRLGLEYRPIRRCRKLRRPYRPPLPPIALNPMTPRDHSRILIAKVAHPMGVTVQEVLGTSRKKDVAAVRFLAFQAMRNEGMTLPQIGRVFNRHHTTILNGLRRVSNRPGDATIH